MPMVLYVYLKVSTNTTRPSLDTKNSYANNLDGYHEYIARWKAKSNNVLEMISLSKNNEYNIENNNKRVCKCSFKCMDNLMRYYL